MKPTITDYTDAEIRLGEQGRVGGLEGPYWVCLEGHEDEGPFDTHAEAQSYLADRQAESTPKRHSLCDDCDDYDPVFLDPPHGVDTAGTDVTTMADAMRQIGWVGHPLLAIRTADAIQCLTGSHRIAAARMAEINVPVYIVDQELFEAWVEDDRADTWESLLLHDDDSRLAALHEIGDADAIQIMEHELSVFRD